MKEEVHKTAEGAIRASIADGHFPRLLGAEVRKEKIDVELVAARAGATVCYQPEHDWYSFVPAN